MSTITIDFNLNRTCDVAAELESGNKIYVKYVTDSVIAGLSSDNYRNITIEHSILRHYSNLDAQTMSRFISRCLSFETNEDVSDFISGDCIATKVVFQDCPHDDIMKSVKCLPNLKKIVINDDCQDDGGEYVDRIVNDLKKHCPLVTRVTFASWVDCRTYRFENSKVNVISAELLQSVYPVMFGNIALPAPVKSQC